jgi:divalent metal cation (Fe/Co/Zn/Cd) transporter
LFTGTQLIRASYKGLMDAADPEVLRRITDVILAHRKPSWIDIHKLRAWNAGPRIHVDLHLILPRDMPLEEAHNEADELERAILDQVPGADSVLVHMDPCRQEDCPVCGQPNCGYREALFSGVPSWSMKSLTTAASDGPRDP